MTENFLQVFKKYTNSELDSIRDYIRHSNKSITDAQQEFEKRLKTVENGETIIRIEKESLEEYEKISQIFPNFFRLSTFIGLYSHLENKMTRLCKRIHERKKFRLRVSDLSGENIIEKSRRYLNLVVGINFDDLNSEWVKITDYQKIRNCFVHNGSNILTDKNVELEKQKLYLTIKKYPLLNLTPYGVVFISSNDFLLDFIQLQKNYTNKLIDKADPIFRA